MSDELLIRHCAPTLAGLKTGSMFSCAYSDREEVVRSIGRLNRLLVKKGICVMPLRFHGGRALIYVYRPARLGRDLEIAEARRLLVSMGYTPEEPERCLRTLVRRLAGQNGFPHEIGLFLGYPPEDVAGFIENGARDYKFVGCWKVYGDEERARRVFAQYERCSRAYYDAWRRGKSIERLAAAAG